MKNFYKILKAAAYLLIITFIFACSDSFENILTGDVSIVGIAQVGQTLTTDTSTLNGIGVITYQWTRKIDTGERIWTWDWRYESIFDEVAVGSNSSTYLLTANDVGSTIAVTVTRIGYLGSVISLQTAVIVPAEATPGLDFQRHQTEYSVSRGTATAASVVIPHIYNGLPVTSIGDFRDYVWMTSITIPDSVTSIGSNAFSGCTGLTSIVIPNSVTSIGSSAFSGCTSLESITIPFVGSALNAITNTYFGFIFGAPTWTGQNSSIPTSLKTVIITGGNNIGWGAFTNCIGLTSITIPDSVTEINGTAFWGCTGLTSIIIPSSVTSIGQHAFWGCTGLTSIIIPSSVISIGQGAFSGCTGLTNIVIPDSVTSIGQEAFSGCTGLTSIVIPDSVTEIGWSAFSGCTGLISVTLGTIHFSSDAFPGNLHSAYFAVGGGAGTYERETGSDNWVKQ